MKKIILIICSFYFIFSCSSQQNERLNQPEKEQIINEKYNNLLNPDTSYPHITKDNYVETMMKVAKESNYDQEPAYYVKVDNKHCGYEVLVNDMPEELNYEGIRYSSPFILNSEILKSGKQDFTYRLYPTYEVMGDSTVFPEDASFEIRIYRRDNRTGFREEQLILEHKAQIRQDGKWVFPAIGKNYYENTVTFNAEVPYALKGWTDGQNLTKLNQRKLEEEVLRFYHKQWFIAKKKDIDAWYSYQYPSKSEVTRSYYYKDEDWFNLIQKQLLNNSVNLDIIEMCSFDNYVMRFYGGGKVISFRLKDKAPNRNGESALYFSYKNEKKKGRMYTDLYLYLPEGRELKADNFIIIR